MPSPGGSGAKPAPSRGRCQLQELAIQTIAEGALDRLYSDSISDEYVVDGVIVCTYRSSIGEKSRAIVHRRAHLERPYLILVACVFFQ